jgi:cobalt-zinc-cadmium efflux system membrane fusion protein
VETLRRGWTSPPSACADPGNARSGRHEKDGRGKKDEAGHHDHEAREDTDHREGEDADLLRIDREMLRDLRVTTAGVEVRESGDRVSALGELHVNEDAYAEVVVSIPARVLATEAAPGDFVEAGRALARLQSVELGKARAEHAAALARAHVARQTLARKRGLAAERIIARREVQEAEAEAASAEAALEAAAGALQALGVAERHETPAAADPSQFLLRSPIAGTVVERSLVLGQLAQPGATLFRIADLSRLWLIAHAFERDAVRVQPGATARVTFPALPGRTFSGTVALVGHQVEVSSRTIPVRIEVANDGGSLRPGMSASVWISVADSGGSLLALPAAALQRVGSSWCVFVPRGEGVFEMRPVGRGRDLGGEVEIVSGLSAGEVVVVEGAFLLKAEADRARGEGGHHDH